MEDQARDLQAAQDERAEADKIRHDQQMRIQRLHLIVGVLVGVLTALTLVVGLGWLPSGFGLLRSRLSHAVSRENDG